MRSILLLVLLGTIVHGQKAAFIQLPAINEKHHVNIEERYSSEIKCIKKLDAILRTQWTKQLNTIPTTDLRNIPMFPWEDRESLYTQYNSFEDEWLMAEGSPTNKIHECVQRVMQDTNIPLNHHDDLGCLTELLSSNTKEENDYKRDFEYSVNMSSVEQLPFRKFISFLEIVELIFQNRDLSTWTNLETLLYAHTKGYVSTEADNKRRNYFISQNCEWKNAKALRNAPDEAARLKEFTSQVRHTVNLQLAGRLIKNWNLDTILPKDRYQLWLKSHQEMTLNIEREVERLRNQDNDPQWLCEHATKLATNFANVQSNILITKEKSSVHLEATDVASRAKAIAMVLAERNDTRQTAIREIAEHQDVGSRCLSSLVRFVENHRKYELASAFIDEKYEFPELYCENDIENLGLNRFTFCNCIGSFCVTHYLAALFSEEYVLVKSSNGIYKVVRSGIVSKRKVPHCHTLANESEKL